MPDFLDRLLARAYGEEPVVTPVRRTRFERGPDAIAAWPAADAAEPVLPRDGPDDRGAADVPVDNSDVDDLEAPGTRRRPAPVPLAPRAPAAARAGFRAPRPAIAVGALVPKSATPRRDADRREPVPHDAVARVETPQPTPRRGARPGTADPDTARGLAPDRDAAPEAAPELPAVRRPVRPERPVETGPSATGQGDGPDPLKPAAVVQVRIGRVEVRAAAPSSPPSGPPAPSRTPSRPQPAAAPAAAGLSLDAYLERARRRS
jgi:hypothetical protein